VLVHGEPGVGKTLLAGSVADRARASGHTVLFARCLRFGAGASPYLPFLSAFEGWVGEGHTDAGLDLGPLYGDHDGAAPVSALHVIDRAIAHLAEQAPVVLVVDDLQWADVSSLDALAYLIAGRRRQPVALLVTYRDVGLPDGHPLWGWLADMLRLPGVVDLPLDRLTLEETAEQLTALWGKPPATRLLHEVWERSGGNAYLTELLARDVDPAADALPADIPDALRTALLARWHSLTPRAREVTQVLAIAGRPVDPGVLAEVTGGVDVSTALHEAGEAGVVEREPGGLIWFRHPLLADVLDSTLLPAEARDLHAAFVRVLAADPDPLRSRTDLALHYAGAGMYDESFEMCLTAAAEAAAAHRHPEASVLLRQACDLWPDVSEAVRSPHGSLAALLTESAESMRQAGDLTGALEQLDRAMTLLDEEQDPLVAARVFRLHAQRSFIEGGRVGPSLLGMRRAVELSAAVPDSEEHALALADLADAELWLGESAAAAAHAQQAAEVADRSGDPATRSYALSTLANVRVDADGAEELGWESLRLAREADRDEYVSQASISLYNVLDNQGRLEAAVDVLLQAYARGSSYSTLTVLLGVYAASGMLPLGRLREARVILRDVLAIRPAGITGLQARETAVVIGVRTGDLEEAATHLHWLREMADHFEDFPGMHGPGVWAEYLLATGRPREALDVLERTIEVHSTVEPKYGDTLLLWAARAASGLPRSQRRPVLDRIHELRARCPVPAFAGGDRDPVQRAVEALHTAEVARCLVDPEETDRWRAAIPLADAAGLRFVAAEARLRLAEALLVVRNRREGAALLREAHARAEEMGAMRLRDEVTAVAASARVTLEEPVVPAPGNGHGSAAELQGGLTQREREVLAHLVAGRSNGEIASSLFISEKTVSVHVSNLLRKTGTSSRVEAAAWARRSGLAGAG
jgi:DNA-binding CsgD family transcriptional regulator/tetratricopeptide (TPR) repeat protein